MRQTDAHLSVTSVGSLRRRNAASRPAMRCSKRSGSPGYPAAVTMATLMPERISTTMWPTCARLGNPQWLSLAKPVTGNDYRIIL